MNIWNKLRDKCQYQESCDCGQGFLCNKLENLEGICEEDSCPIMKKVKNE